MAFWKKRPRPHAGQEDPQYVDPDLVVPDEWNFDVNDSAILLENQMVFIHHGIPEDLADSIDLEQSSRLAEILRYTELEDSSPVLLDYYRELIERMKGSLDDRSQAGNLVRLINLDHNRHEIAARLIDAIEGVSTSPEFLFWEVRSISTHAYGVGDDYLADLYRTFALPGYLTRLELLHGEVVKQNLQSRFDTRRVTTGRLEQILRYNAAPEHMVDELRTIIG